MQGARDTGRWGRLGSRFNRQGLPLQTAVVAFLAVWGNLQSGICLLAHPDFLCCKASVQTHLPSVS